VTYRVKDGLKITNKTDNTKQVRHGILLLKCLHLPKSAQQRLNYQRHQNIKIIIAKNAAQGPLVGIGSIPTRGPCAVFFAVVPDQLLKCI
jgi:hypothetical protein